LLDRLCVLGRHPRYTFEDGHPDPPDRDWPAVYRQFRELAQERFPGLQPYNLPDPISEKPGEAQIVVADPYDDIADIAGDLAHVRWSLENTSPNDALWHFHFGYQSHWGDHASNLRWYLYAREYSR
jgi:hypothetical protein